ncbi:hypothetical protein diail_3411 [Diaporthe ilicicola]|nr:hypothetical protein diail_3411 [Diaporthe ilicicola]
MTLEGIFNHLVLPPKLPGGQDPHLDKETQEFVGRLVTAIETLDKATNELYTEPLSCLRRSLDVSGRLNRGSLDRDTLIAAFQDLKSDPLILYVVEQNAALIVRQSRFNETGNVIFEAFEASPSSEEVLESENALIQSFPGCACALPESTFYHDDFQASLADFLEKASMETLNRLAAHTRKAGVEISEVRDTTNPAMITQLLLPLLEALGSPVQVDKFQKRVRDDVNIEVESRSGSTVPFRRHPFWLILRVAVQRQLILSLGYSSGRALYKSVIAVVLAQLMTDVAGQLKPELTLTLRAKLCRRLAKLEQEKAQGLEGSSVYDCFLSSMGPWLEQTIGSVTAQMDNVWAHFKRRTMRHVEPLPAAHSIPSDHLRLQLRQSGTFLDGILRSPPEGKAHTNSVNVMHIDDEGIKQVQIFTARYLRIVALENEIRSRRLQDQPKLTECSSKTVGFDSVPTRNPVLPKGAKNDPAGDRCVELAEFIFKYFHTVANAYDSNPMQMSAFVLNLLHLWVLMDLEAIEVCPLLKEYHPIFTANLLDVLQLQNPEDFDRLSVIQGYLTWRMEACKHESYDILNTENPSRCFAARYAAGCNEMQSLHREILEECKESREEKEDEWEDVSMKCEQYSQDISALPCICTGEPGNRTKDDIQNCTKCFYRRARNRLKIRVHEDFLPAHWDQAAKIVFELSMPRWYEAYRSATFKVISDLAWPTRTNVDKPPLILRDFEQLEEYQHARIVTRNVTLASPTKSFLQTHWRDVQVLRGSLDEVLRPHAPKFDLYDVVSKVWINAIDRKALTFHHICGVLIPECLQEKVLAAIPHPPAVVDGPSSYAVIANQRQCPRQVSVHEFSAYQRLLAGTSRRWITMLVELGSSHLNFSSSETNRLLSQLALQAGPPGIGGLREAYCVFADDTFCDRLAELVDQKLNSIKSNWREVNLLDLCITLSQRLLEFSTSHKIREKAQTSIACARIATLSWIGILRGELSNTKDASSADRAADYAFKAALLCRRTFATVSDDMTADQLKAYCEATIALQENMKGGFDSDPMLKAMVIQDTKMNIRSIIYSSLCSHPGVLGQVIARSWSAAGASTDTVFDPWTAAEGEEPWVVTQMTTTCTAAKAQSFTVRQTVHFNYVSGFLLVDGKPAGRLPERIRESNEIKELFGQQAHLRTYPSVQSGMSHMLIGHVEGWQIHFGLRGEKVIVRAASKWGILEFIPRQAFIHGTDYDLPVDLIESCVHFLNLSTGALQVHRRPKIWRLKPRDWVINLGTRYCTRQNPKHRLICPYSVTSQNVASLFRYFESPEYLTTFLTNNYKLRVDLSRFELTFHVNDSHRLEEVKLGKEIDPNQDAGTLYGLLTKLVLRDIADPSKRTIIGGFQSGVAPPEGLGKLIEDTVVGQFGELVDFSRFLSPDRLYSLAFRLALLSFKPRTDLGLLEVFVAIARLDALKVLVPPQHPVFVDFDLAAPTINLIETMIRSTWPEFVQPRGKKRSGAALCEQHLMRCEEEGRRLARWFVKQWPSNSPSVDGFQPETKLIDEAEALESILEVWQRKVHNLELGHYIDEIQQILHKVGIEDDGVLLASQPVSLASTLPHRVPRTSPVIPSLPHELLNKAFGDFNGTAQLESASAQLVQTRVAMRKDSKGNGSKELQGILTPFLESQDQLRKQYGEDLLHSLQAMMRGQGPVQGQTRVLRHQYKSESQMNSFIDRTRIHMGQHYQSIVMALEQGDRRALWLRWANLWPASKLILLEQLRSKSEVHFGGGMKEALVRFGIKHTELQWLERLRHSLLTHDNATLQELLKNTGHQNWDPLERPDWLLMELECDLLIRPEQVEVANAIISPVTGANSVLQMNMGQGKTSCIVPMSMSILADTTQIARLVVPKALLLQSAQVVQSRIGGLVGREIRHIPFSRRTATTDEILRLYRDLHKEVREDSGVLLTTSDHMLSFKLSGLQRLVDSKTAEAETMIRFQETLTRFSRDVIDESDFTLGVKTQLIYPSGPQLSVDGAPYRWLIIQDLLHMFEQHLPAIRKAFPISVEVVPRSEKQVFPMAFLLRSDAEDEFHRLIIEDIANNRTSFLRLSESGPPPKKIRRTIQQFLSEASTKKQDKDGLKDVVSLFADQEFAAKVLLLVRGLILNKILLFCMKRRYNVQYGLHPTRDPMAVPFEAKGVPHESSEFGHPDVAIILTTLSFYYAGLTLPQFRQSLSSVLKADDAAAAYDRWTHGCDTLPAALRHWNVINCDDAGQVEELHSHLRLDRNVLNFYLNGWVFPLYAKQFGMKLSASAWDLPNFARPQKSALPGARSTGFSGTNDNKLLLPLTIRQDDLPGLVQTNAEVLSYLLQERNRSYHLAAYNGNRMTEQQLLNKLVKERIKVLIDAGAYVLELSNEALVRTWLDTNPKANAAKAGVFFGNDNRAWVLYRGVKNKKVPLVATPFADNLEDCLVFLDEAHCRQTKDQTVQAAMRLRQLATTQSVAFFAGPEVHQSIIDVCKLRETSNRFITSAHVVQWLLEQSCSANEQLANLHLAQGVDYCRRLNAQWKYDQFLTIDEQRMMLLKVIQQQERQTLNQQYGRVSDSSIKGSPDEVSFPSLKGFMSTLADQRRSMDSKLSASGMRSSALEEVEQEREVEFQVEEVRQIQKQKVFKPLLFTRLHPAFEDFIKKGRLAGDEGFIHAFSFLKSTSIGQKFMVQPTESRFFVSTEFTRTVVLSKEGQNKHPDNFLRPVEWILWSHSTETALVIIPEEAELLIPIIRTAGPRCPVHLITYATPVTKSTLQNFNDLVFYNMPPLPDDYQFPKWFTVELGIFAGRLYLTYDECALVAQYLHVSQSMEDQLDGTADQTFAKKPITFMSEWLALRRQSDIQQTPMGYILKGKIETLHPEHAFFTTKTAEVSAMLETLMPSCKVDESSDDGEDDDDCSVMMDHDEDENEQGWDDDVAEDPGQESPADG